jgi:hypothetical protein
MWCIASGADARQQPATTARGRSRQRLPQVLVALLILATSGVAACQSSAKDQPAAPDALQKPIDTYVAALGATVVAHNRYRSAVFGSMSSHYDALLIITNANTPSPKVVQATVVPARDRRATALQAEAAALAQLNKAITASKGSKPALVTTTRKVSALGAQKAAVDSTSRKLAGETVNALLKKARVCYDAKGIGGIDKLCQDKFDVKRFNAVIDRENKLAITSNKLLQQMRVALAGVPAELIRVLGTPPLSEQIAKLGVGPLRSLNSTTLKPYTDDQISKALDIVQRTGGIRGASTLPLVPLK